MSPLQFRDSQKAPEMVEYDQDGMIHPQQAVDDEIERGILELFNAVLASKLQHKHEHLFTEDYLTAMLRKDGIEWRKRERCSCADKSEQPL
jgi:hypothetical protein